jgi:hypothetical protein
MSFLRAALRYAELGFGVIPIRPREKTPLCEHGEHAATTDASIIEQWGAGWPVAGVGLVPSFSCHFVLDVDARHYGVERLYSLPPLPDTVTALTGGGGLHIWLKCVPALQAVRTSRLHIRGLDRSGIDIKGLQHGYVVVSPSIHKSGRVYTWEASSRIDELAIAEPPGWLIESLLSQGTRPRPIPSLARPVDPESFVLGRLFRWKGLLGPQIRPGCFAVRCPTEHFHSQGKPFDTSTVLFAPPPGSWNDRGTFYCSHSSFCTEEWR